MYVDDTWNWQKPDWPLFTWAEVDLAPLESEFLLQVGEIAGSVKHLGPDEQHRLRIEILTSEALKTSEIEGELLDRDSVQSSLLRNFGFKGDSRRVGPAEGGMADLQYSLYTAVSKGLTEGLLKEWHSMAVRGRSDLHDVGRWRTDPTPMQVVSGAVYQPKVHFEAPPAVNLAKEMVGFFEWWHSSRPGGEKPLSPLLRASIAHLYFVCIHPFEDGNGRLARALAELSLMESVGHPLLIALSTRIESDRKGFYQALECNNKSLEIGGWVAWFAKTILAAQKETLQLIEFLIAKTRFYDRLAGLLNDRQYKVLARMFEEGPAGFTGGLSADKYIRLTKTSRATATRDLADLVDKKALFKTGELKSTRYHLNLSAVALS